MLSILKMLFIMNLWMVRVRGKIIINSPDNYPVLTEYPAKTHEQEIAEAEGMKKMCIRDSPHGYFTEKP